LLIKSPRSAALAENVKQT